MARVRLSIVVATARRIAASIRTHNEGLSVVAMRLCNED